MQEQSEKQEGIENFKYKTCAEAELNWDPDWWRCPCCYEPYSVYGVVIHRQVFL